MAAASLLLLAPLLAAPCSGQQPPGGAKPRTSGHAETSRSQGEHIWMNSEWGMFTRSRGDVVFTPDGRDVARLGPDAYLLLRRTSGGTTRQVEYRPGASGVERRYTVDGVARPFDAAARAWAAEFLASVGPKTTIAMGDRLRATLASRGVNALLDELEQISNTATRRDFLVRVIETRTLTPAESRRILRMAAGLPGSSARREVFSALAARGRLTGEEGAVQEYIAAARTVSSSSDRREALGALIRGRSLPQAAAVAWLRAVAEIGTDSDKAALLLAAIGRVPDDPATRAAYRDAVETIRSDTHYNRVATAFLRQQTGSR